MSVKTQRNLTSVFVAKDVAGTAIASITNLDAMADGQVIALKSTGAALAVGDDYADSEWIQIVKKLVIDGVSTFQYSPKIYGKDVVAYKGVEYVAPQEQIWVLGYNGTSGSIDTTETSYMLSIVFNHDDMFWSEQKKRLFGNYESSSPTQKSVAMGIASAINMQGTKSTLEGVGPEVKVEVISDGTQSDFSGAATHMSVVNGSTAVIFTNGSGVAAAGEAFADGQLIGIAGATYMVSGTGTTAGFTLSFAYQGATAEVAGGVTYATQAGDLATVTNYGIKVTGKQLTWVKDFFSHMKVSFHFDKVGFGATAVTKTQEAKKGNGNYRDVAEWESFAAGNEGALNRTVVPFPIGRIEANSTIGEYDCVQIMVKDTQITNTVAGSAVMPFDIKIFLPDADAGVTTVLLSQLDPWFASLPRPFAAAGI